MGASVRGVGGRGVWAWGVGAGCGRGVWAWGVGVECGRVGCAWGWAWVRNGSSASCHVLPRTRLSSKRRTRV